MNGETFEGLLKWVMEKESRTMDINVGRLQHFSNNISAFVYDYELNSGQQVTSVEDIDLLKARIDTLDALIERRTKLQTVGD